jgi:hypothetical protein
MNDNTTSGVPGPIEAYIYRYLAGAALGLLLLGTVIYRWLEDWSWIDSLYFCTVAVTTVGFGDLAPSTDASKLFTVAYLLTGVSLIATFLDARLQRRGRKRIKSVE